MEIADFAKEHQKRTNKLYRQTHPEKVAKWDRDYRKKHPERYKQNQKRSRDRHKDHIRLYKRIRVQNLRQKLIHLLGNKCVQCGFSDYLALEIDHVNNDGNRHRKQFCQESMYLQMIREISLGSRDYQLLCANCNRIKEIDWKQMKDPNHNIDPNCLTEEFLCQ